MTYIVEYAKHIEGITVVNEIMEKDDVCLVPWLGWRRMEKIQDWDPSICLDTLNFQTFT